MAEEMSSLSMVRYEPALRSEWNAAVEASRNGTFLFHRDYMEYHADRFPDHSYCFYWKGRLIALLPAHQSGDMLCSHAGLTYGGLLLLPAATLHRVSAIFSLLAETLPKEGMTRLLYKCIPYHLHRYPVEEDRYLLFRRGALLTACNVASVVDLSAPLRFSELRLRGMRKAQAAGVVVGESEAWPEFWSVLQENLRQRFGAEPVHTLEEIERLHALFPDKIRLFTATVNGRIEGGTVLYECGNVARTQYISASPQGKACGALDLLFAYLLQERYASFRYFDFGTSNGDNGRFLNEGLVAQKEGFGGRSVVYETYLLTF
ncbi:MAG: GNAT family N-acetyltransferase [Porphyromonadaceae bacterium]|nr:GNAT family N-acetyltransferase [Porphyromonadaceae bacterium]